jgi:hypothetical protein
VQKVNSFLPLLLPGLGFEKVHKCFVKDLRLFDTDHVGRVRNDAQLRARDLVVDELGMGDRGSLIVFTDHDQSGQGNGGNGFAKIHLQSERYFNEENS